MHTQPTAQFGPGPSIQERLVGLVAALAGVFAFISVTADISSVSNWTLGAVCGLITYLAYQLHRRLEHERKADYEARGLVPPLPAYDPHTVPPVLTPEQQAALRTQAANHAIWAEAHPIRARVNVWLGPVVLMVYCSLFVLALLIVWQWPMISRWLPR